MARQCEHTKPDGERCRANALAGAGRCFHHSPDVAGERRAARQKGGRERSKPAAVLPGDTPDVPAEAPGDLVKLLAATINQTRRGELDPKVANAIGYLASVQQRLLQGEQLAARVEMLERVLKERGGGGGR